MAGSNAGAAPSRMDVRAVQPLELQIDSSDSQLPFYEEAFDQDFEAS